MQTLILFASLLFLWGTLAPAARARSAPFTLESLRALIAASSPRSSAELMALLPSDLRGRFLLAYESESLQKATPLCPRVILFEDDASLILAFSGYREGMRCGDDGATVTAAEAGADVVEAIQFREDTKTFSFQSLVFARDGARIDADSATCAACHTSSLRPNWDSYDVWPKFYGTVDDGIPVDFPEGRNFRRMVTQNRAQGIYGHLLGLGPLVAHRGHSNNDHDGRYYALSAQQGSYEKILHHPYDYLDGGEVPRPNLKFTHELNHLNFKRIAHELRQRLPDARSRWLILAALLKCDGGSLAAFLPGDAAASYSARIQDLRQEYRDGVQADFRAKAARIRALVAGYDHDVTRAIADNPASPIFDDEAVAANIRFVLQPHGLSMRDWGMAFGVPQQNFLIGNRGLQNLLAPFAAELALTDPALADLAVKGWQADGDRACRRLKALAR